MIKYYSFLWSLFHRFDYILYFTYLNNFYSLADFGNFNYGATGRAASYDGDTLLRAGGVVQTFTGTSRFEFGDYLDNIPFIGNNNPNTSYGDDPRDQDKIQQGIDWYDENYE